MLYFDVARPLPLGVRQVNAAVIAAFSLLHPDIKASTANARRFGAQVAEAWAATYPDDDRPPRVEPRP